ncbi:hypothetical protein OOK13_29310 [Streptomyces sp. NBC_00378]|uniref:hypothetical protein n=1 Tax=unclassified Streptomyces TaxID=2593676 RepID=UPI002250175D|nr:MULTISPECIES: hypothetical protein [unclassified Streptomyces]MCX5112503.1 hypothetical protein [Streptomyces sp. NBC_00378]
MTSSIVRRTLVAIASTAIAAAGLLATGGTASAATHPSSTQPGAVSTVRITDHHDGDRHGALGDRGSDARGHWKQDRDGGRHWIRHDDRHGYQVRIDEDRRQWVLDQIRWAEDHGHTYWGSLEHHDRSDR